MTGWNGIERRKDNDDKLDDLISQVKSIKTLLIGDGKEPGLAEKVRGIEGIINHVKAIWIAIAGFIIDFIFRIFFHHPRN